MLTERPPLGVFGVGHEPQPLPDVRYPDAVCAQYGHPAGVARALQVSENSVEPAVSNRRFNLLPKDDWRAALADEPEPVGPEMAGVIGSLAPAGCAEWLARAGSGPDGPILRPPRELERVSPPADAGEEVALREVFEFCWLDIGDGPFIHGTCREKATMDQFSEPSRNLGVVVVVVDHSRSIEPA